MSRFRLDKARGQRRQINATQSITHAERLTANGWTHVQIAEAAGIGPRTVGELFGRERVHATTARAILSVPIGPPPAPPRNIDATGTRRRLQALAAIGWEFTALAPRFNITLFALRRIANGDMQLVRSTTAADVAREYKELSEKPGGSARARNLARKKEWAPPATWDDIDDPQAHPEWTGHCGTDRGWWTHSAQKIPACPPCEAAHDAWKAERRHLPRSEYMAALQRARSAAANREAGLAEDGRELMRFGADYEQAAARLGVTRQHLQQALVRHPAQQDLEAAA